MRKIALAGPAQRLCIYIGESDNWRGKPLYAAILETLKAHELAGATVVRGVAGFGAHSHAIHTAAILRLSQDLPLRIEVVDTPARIAEALEIIGPMVGEGLVTVEEVQVVRYTHRYLNPLPADRLVSEVMTRDVVTVGQDATIAEAWHVMLDRGVKTLPVVGQDGKVAGILTDDDLLKRAGLRQRLAVARQLDLTLIEEEFRVLTQSSQLASEIMSRPALVVRDSDSLGHAAQRMTKQGVKRLPVVNAKGELVGVLSRVDVLRQVADVKPERRAPELVTGSERALGDVMSPIVPTVHQEDGLDRIITAFVETGSHRLIVTGEGGQVLGLISDADVIARLPAVHHPGLLAALRGRSAPPALTVTAGDLMSAGALSAPPEMPIVEALRLALPKGRKWIVVTDQDNKPVGLVDRTILLAAVTAAGGVR